MKLSQAVLSITMQFLSCRFVHSAGTGLLPRSSTATAAAFINAVGTSKTKALQLRSSPVTRLFSTKTESDNDATDQQQDQDVVVRKSPWAPEHPAMKKKPNKSRFRQHVNPLARKFQMQTEINDGWPTDGTFADPTLPLHIDIGCGKGGFLLDLCSKELSQKDADDGDCETRNYLGLEIRPSVAQYAKERIAKWNLNGSLDFIGCNANVDLDRILGKYTRGGEGGEITMVSIQYPDPHFKKSHQKRRVVTPELVEILAKHLPPKTGTVFIQSDIKDVLDSMRETLRESGSEYFEDALENVEDYLEENPIGVQTEREKSVLEQNLPVYRTIFRRTENII